MSRTLIVAARLALFSVLALFCFAAWAALVYAILAWGPLL